MATTFETAFLAAGRPELMHEHGTTVLYKARGLGAGTSITVMFLPGRTLPQYMGLGEQVAEVAVIEASPADTPQPHVDDTFVRSGETWAVATFAPGPLVAFQLERRTQRNVGQQGGRVIG